MANLGECPKCTKGSRPVLLIGGLCSHHFKNPDAIIQRDAHEPKQGKKDGKKALDKWFDEQIKQIPPLCENCGNLIIPIAGMTKRSYIAHIVPKSKVKSVATHEDNRLFLCLQCHTDFDGRQDKAAKMPVVKLAKERLKNFIHLIPEKEMKYVPGFLKE